MKKLLSLLGAIGLVATSGATVVSCDNGDKDSTTTDFSADFSTFTDLASITTAITTSAGVEFSATTSVSFYANIDEVNTVEDEAINNTEPGDDAPVKIEDIDVIKAMKSVAYLAMEKTGEGEDMTSTTVLKGTITNKTAAPVEKIDLAEAVKVTELGEIADTKPATIVAAMNKANEGLVLTEADVEITPNEEGATVKATDASENFTGSVNVTFTVGDVPATKTDLAEAVKTTALGEIDDTNAATIVAAMNTANEGLNLTEADVEITLNKDNKGATVKATDASENFTGSVDVTFTVTEA
jgi:Zn finger protein HypA/HybF involved in hydrogenase expression